jgi:hypothetical protein
MRPVLAVVAAAFLLGAGPCGGGDATAPLTSTGVGRFNGTYSGSWSSVDQEALGQRDSSTLTFTVANGAMTGSTTPGTISTGTVSASGELTGSGLFNGHLNCIGGALTVTFAGGITISSSGVAQASGMFGDPSPHVSGLPHCVGSSGPWTATRTR